MSQKNEKALTTKQDILGVVDKEVKKIYVEPWEAHVFIRVMSGTERDAFEVSLTGGGETISNLQNFRAKLCALCLCDEEGKNLFTEKDVRELGKKSGKALNIIMAHAKKLNGITAEDQEAIVKNLGSAPENDSSSSSA